MSRMLELVRASALPFHQMMSASKGALHVPSEEMVEILVHLAEHNKIFGETARLTLAGWDEEVCKNIAGDPKAPKEVLDYWLAANNIRPALFPVLIENPSVPVAKLSELAATLKGEFIDVMIASLRVRNSPQLLRDLSTNHYLSGVQSARVQALITGHAEPVEIKEEIATTKVSTEQAVPEIPSAEPEPVHAAPISPDHVKSEPDTADPESESALVAFFAEHASEIAAEADKPFQPIGGIRDEQPAETESKAAAAAASATTPPTSHASTAGAHPAVHKKLVNPLDEQRGSVLQKIARLDVKGRIQLGMKGTKEERSILVRDGTKIVALAVLDSPKITDGEIEKFATQKNVLEAVLRAIPMKRRFAKNYAVVRNLVFNPRTPLDVSLGLIKNLLTADLRNLSGNKEVSETVRKLALRMFKQKSESASKNK
jgi:hypothetical protein